MCIQTGSFSHSEKKFAGDKENKQKEKKNSKHISS